MKFAKFIPLPSVNEAMMKQAKEIVNSTIPKEPVLVEEEVQMFSGITFAYPWVLYFLLIIPLMIAWYFFRGMKIQSSVTYSSINIFKDVPATFRERLRHIPFAVRLIAIGLLIIALARPQSFSSGENVTTEGIDIAMVLDISGSMLAEDFKPNRLEAAKNVIDNFVEGRISDRIGLVIFSREAFTQCPLTIDYNVLRNLTARYKNRND